MWRIEGVVSDQNQRKVGHEDLSHELHFMAGFIIVCHLVKPTHRVKEAKTKLQGKEMVLLQH
jgi:hypothetical protein